LVRKLERKRPLRRPRRRWEDNIRTYLREIGCEGVDWVGSGWGSMETVTTFRFHNRREFLD
jgi:hypothetical protein